MEFYQLASAMKQNGFRLSGQMLPFATSVQDYLARHDIVFLSPQKGGFEGLPLGNGDLAAMVWTTERAIVIQINKSDLWTQPDAEAPMLLRSCGQLRIEFDMPCFELLYLNQFELRLSLGTESVQLRAETPFALIQAEIWIDPDQNILSAEIQVRDENGEDLPFRVMLERYGSRSFAQWYNNMHSGAEHGLGKSRVSADREGVTLVEPFSEQDHIALAMRLKAGGTSSVVQNRCGEIICRSPALLTTAVSVENTPAEAEETLSRMQQETEAPVNARKARRNAWWKEYWNRSFLTLSPDGSDPALSYLENLYYVQVYALGCGSRGKYPMIFNGGTFTWNHDLRQWVNPHHWNIQQSYWAVEGMNRPEQMLPYLKTYSRIIPQAKKFAGESHHVSRGLLISEQHDFSGRMISYYGALTPAMQIARQFWNHYLYNADLHDLRETGYPYIRECADFYAEYAEWDEKTGKYSIGPAACCECDFGENFWNTSVDLAMLRYILPAAIQASELLQEDTDRREKWQHLYDHLPDFSYREEEGREVLAVALDENGEKVDFKKQNHTFCRDTSPIMPCPVIGSRDRGTRLYEAVRNAAESYPRSAVAITPISVIWARLGDGNRALQFLYHAVRQLQHFPQGFYYNIDHWYQYSRYAKEAADPLTECQRDYIYDETLEYSGIRVRDTGEITDLPMQPFAQPGFETPGILTLCLQEMFLQSYEGVLRLGPALPENLTGAFTLKAAGAFLATGFARAGKLLPLAVIRSEAGQPCRLELWFAPEELRLCTADGEEIPFETTPEGDILFCIEKGQTALLWSSSLKEADIPQADFPVFRNEGPKNFQEARIGSKAML